MSSNTLRKRAADKQERRENLRQAIARLVDALQQFYEQAPEEVRPYPPASSADEREAVRQLIAKGRADGNFRGQIDVEKLDRHGALWVRAEMPLAVEFVGRLSRPDCLEPGSPEDCQLTAILGS